MMDEDKYDRKVQPCVTCFIFCGNKYLFLKRADNKRVEPGKLNGVGGRLEENEEYLAAAIREVEEETGYRVEPKDIRLAGVVNLFGGYRIDYIMCFFKVRVESLNIPKGNDTEDGKLLWLDKDEVLDSGYDLVDDINYCFKDIVAEEKLFFISAKVGEDLKIIEANISRL